MRNETLRELYLDQLRDLYSAETQLIVALPAMAQQATDPQLTQGFTEHLAETRQQLARLEQLFELMGESPAGKVCKAMQGLLEEGRDVSGENESGPVLDAALIAAAQRVEHYEIAAYGTVVRFAEVLGLNDHVQLLRTTENEEKKADEKLTQLASNINQAARG